MTLAWLSNKTDLGRAMIRQTHERIAGNPANGILIVADHASAHVPDDVDLGICPSQLARHIAVDIGVDPLTRALAANLRATAILACVSRLVIDLNREEDAPGLIPTISDGVEIPGNTMLDDWERDMRITRFHRTYHAAISREIRNMWPALIVSVHSFTPRLESRPEEARPWQIGILYNDDDRAARLAIPMLEAQGLAVGDQQPYSGRVLNHTMNLHAEEGGIPYLGIEVRQDELADRTGVSRWCRILSPVIAQVAAELS